MASPKNSENSDDSSSSSDQQTVIHKFVLVRKARHCHRGEEEEEDDDDEDRYELEQGENWLKFLPKPGRSVLDDTQDIDVGMTQEQYPSILSLASVGSLEDDLIPSKDCYLCIDVYGDVIAVKDMRLPDTSSNINNDGDRGREGEMISSLEQHKNQKELGVSRKDVWEPLPRRQMQLLSAGDKLCTALGHMADGTSFPGGLIFQYRMMERVNMQAANRSKNSSLFVKPEPTTPGGMISILTQPQEDEAKELDTQSQTEPTPVKSSKDDDMDIAKDDGDDDDDDDSEKTLEFELQHPLGPSEILATQPNSDSDDETSLGDGERHSGDSDRLDPTIPAQVILTSNSEEDEDKTQEKPKSILVKDHAPADSQATASDSQLTDTLGQDTQEMMTQATLRNSQLTAVLHGETQDATQATQLTMALQGETQHDTQATVRNSQLTEALQGETQDATQTTQLTMALQEETQDATQATVRNSQLAAALQGDTQDATQATQLAMALQEEIQDATQGAASESLTNTGLAQLQEKDDNDKEMEEASSQSSDAKSETLLRETGPDRPNTESFPDPIIQDISKDDDAVLSTSVEAGRVSLSQESILKDKKQTLEKDGIPLNTALSSEPVTSTDAKEKESSAPPTNDDKLDEKVEQDEQDTSEKEADALAFKENGSPTKTDNEKNENRTQNDVITPKTLIENERAADIDVLVESAIHEKDKTPPSTLDDTAEPNPQDMDVDSVADQEGKTDARDKPIESTIENETANARDQTIQDDNEMPPADDEDDDETQVPGKPISRDIAATDDNKSSLQSQTSKQEETTQQGIPQAVSSPGHINLDHRPPAKGQEDNHASRTPHKSGSESEVKKESEKSSPESNDYDYEPMKSDPLKKEATLSAESKSKSSQPVGELTLEQAEPATADTNEDKKNDVEPSTPAPRSSRRSRKVPSSSNTTPDTQPASKRRKIEDSNRSAPRSTTKRKTASTAASASTVAPPSSRKKKQSNPTGRPGREEESAGIRVMTTGISLTDTQKNVSPFRLYRTSM